VAKQTYDYLIYVKNSKARAGDVCSVLLRTAFSEQIYNHPLQQAGLGSFFVTLTDPLINFTLSEESVNESWIIRVRRIHKPEKFFRSIVTFLRKSHQSSSLIEIFGKAKAIIRREGFMALFTKLEISQDASYEAWIHNYASLSLREVEAIKEEINAFEFQPLISFVMPVYNPDLYFLREAIEAVLDQMYPNIELVISDDHSTRPGVRELLEEYASTRDRCKVFFSPVNQHISLATNNAIAHAEGKYLAFIDHDDLVSPLATYYVVKALQARPEAKIIYTDEDKIDSTGRRFDPYFKPDWNPILLRSQNYINHLSIIDAELVREVGFLRQGFEGAQDWDLLFRCTELVKPSEIVHVPRVLYHWRAIKGSTARSQNEKDYIYDSQKKAILEHFKRLGLHADLGLEANGYWRASYRQLDLLPLVSIIIPTKDRVVYLKRCVESILNTTDHPNIELWIVNNNSSEPETIEYLSKAGLDGRVNILNYEGAFNFSKINNLAASKARGEFLLLLNNDTEVSNRNWLSEMLSYARMPEVGAVGAKLYYPNRLIQHAGVILGIGGVAGHIYLNKPHYYAGQMNRAKLAQNISAVTGACMLVSKQKYFQVGGLNENDLPITFNDIDFCLKLLEAGYQNVWTPFAELKHYESISRGLDNSPEKIQRFGKEVEYMKKRWGSLLKADPAYNPNLTLSRQDASLAFPPRV
jgi:GT2 family glycosyltransferase